MKNKNNLVGLGLLLLGVLLALGTKWLFPTCDPTESGTWMKCHWSGQVSIGIGAVIAVLAVVFLLVPSRFVRAGLSLAAVPIGLFNLAAVYGLIGLCGSAMMRCRAVTQPGVTILSLAVILLGAANGIRSLGAEHRKKEPTQ